MAPKRILASVMGIIMVFTLVAMVLAWNVTPASAGFTPTATATVAAATASVAVPTATTSTSGRPRATSVPPTATPTPTSTATPVLLTETPTSLVGTPAVLPVTGGQNSGPSDSGTAAVLLAGMVALVLITFSLVFRQSARSKTDK